LRIADDAEIAARWRRQQRKYAILLGIHILEFVDPDETEALAIKRGDIVIVFKQADGKAD
jgi:hypothetical protein